MGNQVYNVLFLCTGNSARSIMAEALLNTFGKGRFRAFSAGSHPAGRVHPLALELLEETQLPVQGLGSKSWEEFARTGGPPLDFVRLPRGPGVNVRKRSVWTRSRLPTACPHSFTPGPHAAGKPQARTRSPSTAIVG